ncbi:efflux RND transporter periplasmic adaptor subunit [Billgrantia endophytica]|uniref:Efflux RND transporter periplasmic adaptor subunit n=1 Tax=Billgrantia endophytica TaxID=2033802 RepID=A0A2N7TYH2_9GAMM|nr:efflux RND transporter periplasmic adaptor subunit [Halomonas endophytica]PMR73242.1 efflux RND transporter periplasmic adaptor subunit [Halomonas endophytica]
MPIPTASPRALHRAFPIARQRGRFHLGALLALLVSAVGLATAWWLISQPPRVERRMAVETPPPLVDVVVAQQRAAAPALHGFGRVIAEREAHLASRVAGQLLDFAPGTLPGMVVEAGAPLAHLDDADLRLALREAEAALVQAQAQLAMERGEQQRAQAEYQSFGRDLPADRRALVLREPQLRVAEAEVERASTARDRARLDLERATLSAPWRGMVQARLLGAGSEVTSGTELLHLVDVSRFWVRASLPGEALAWLAPAAGEESGSPVALTSRGWPIGHERHGALIAVLPALEENGLQAQLLVAVDDPLGLDGKAPPLRLGDVVRLDFTTNPQADLFVLPAAALRPGDEVWVLDEDNRLRRRSVDVVHLSDDRVLLGAGLENDLQVVVSQLGQPREGMRLRPRVADGERPAGADREPAT